MRSSKTTGSRGRAARPAHRFVVPLLIAVSASAGLTHAGDPAITTVRVAMDLNRPVGATSAPGDPSRLFVIEQRGVIKILNIVTGTVNQKPFLDINSLVLGPNGNQDERGLLGLAFHPDYAENGYFYVNYTGNNGATHIRRYRVVDGDPDAADPTSGVTILTFTQPFANHNGGWIAFGPADGYLYIATGDGGSAEDPGNRAQNGQTLLGKMLRIDVDGGDPYGIPPDNPFVGNPDFRDEIWAYGLRNPWRCSFDRETHDLWIGDVGQDAREEINFQPANSPGGENYGWRCMEGNACTALGSCQCFGATLTAPIHDYLHGANGRSVTGGIVYRGKTIPELQGTYFFADFISHRIWTFEEADGVAGAVTLRSPDLVPGEGFINSVASLAEDGLGELYFIDRGTSAITGELYRIVPLGFRELDCNENNLVDAIEVTAGLVSDCNENGIPDSCDLQGGGSIDFNENGIPDECEEPIFIRGDCDNDGVLAIDDPLRLLDHLFGGTGTPIDCQDACDFDDSGGVLDLGDGIDLLNFLFLLGPGPAPPFPACGEDPSSDSDGLGCDGYNPPGNCP